MDTTVPGRGRNRRWPEALKREIVAASLAPGASVAAVARRYEVNANQVFGWRKRFGGLASAAPGGGDSGMVPVVIAAGPPASCGAEKPDAVYGIEIVLAGGHRVRVGASADGAALRLVLDVLAEAAKR
jgi:transposase